MFDSNLFIGVSRNAISRMDNPHADEADAEFKLQKERFFQQIDSAGLKGIRICSSCGFQSKSFQHVHHKNGDHTLNKISNFTIRCPLCHMCEHIGFAGENNMGIIIHAPELTQEQINQILIHSFVLQQHANRIEESNRNYDLYQDMTTNASLILTALEQRNLTIKRDFGTDCPTHFANIFMEMSDEEYAERDKGRFSGIRMLFHKTAFVDEINYWTNQLYGLKGNAPHQWIQSAAIVLSRKHSQ